MLYNCSSVALIEIKYNAQKKHVEQTLTKVESFKTLFPEYKDFALYLGLAGLHVDADAEQEAIKQGIAVVKQIGDTMVINDTNLKVF